MDINPLSVILVENGSKGDRLLFRYPYDPQVSVTKPTRASTYCFQHIIVYLCLYCSSCWQAN